MQCGSPLKKADQVGCGGQGQLLHQTQVFEVVGRSAVSAMTKSQNFAVGYRRNRASCRLAEERSSYCGRKRSHSRSGRLSSGGAAA